MWPVKLTGSPLNWGFWSVFDVSVLLNNRFQKTIRLKETTPI
ncbi:hypothetical protein CWATWH8502_3769 [Crocosphaera watsonii WH 8502]|uniref:Uncharacterized protein n=3 Tax=Crocosphaera watsonii TaxID=263511 RepID=T2JPF4_CROWT|nr:hypothetical protein CWATWH8502_3769 [Crocosphaera watsonii WH 8502]CCQ56507.1 hypothetical protein CWATWH0005_5785 [Crocosphaera watsonii WH 0005]CCQ66901.1 hypothetical protein CWATWH0402_1727 [Crocosphaera watsonii WH 0402]